MMKQYSLFDVTFAIVRIYNITQVENQNGWHIFPSASTQRPLESSSDDVCSLPAVRGPGKGTWYRYHFDITNGNCNMFLFSGTGGNRNNFETIEECLEFCSKKGDRRQQDAENPVGKEGGSVDKGADTYDVCGLPPDGGPEKGFLRRYHFDITKGSCQIFLYSGKGGNRNNFETKEECKEYCRKNVESRQHYGETQGGKKEDIVNEGANAYDVCSLPPDGGPEKGIWRKYYFDITKGNCSTFLYSGKGGNRNNFRFKEECMEQCGKKVDIRLHDGKTQGKEEGEKQDGKKEGGVSIAQGSPGADAYDVCSLIFDRGPGMGFLRRYHFNKTSGECNLFPYSGEGGNKNNFKSEKECLKLCTMQIDDRQIGSKDGGVKQAQVPSEAKPENVCELPTDRGPGESFLRRFHFDNATRQCSFFPYSGAGGNKNNFVSEEECLRTCGKETDVRQMWDGKRSDEEERGVKEFICGENEESNICGTACPLTCDNYKNPPESCSLQCIIGCQCQEGYVRSTEWRCIKPDECSIKSELEVEV